MHLAIATHVRLPVRDRLGGGHARALWDTQRQLFVCPRHGCPRRRDAKDLQRRSGLRQVRCVAIRFATAAEILQARRSRCPASSSWRCTRCSSSLLSARTTQRRPLGCNSLSVPSGASLARPGRVRSANRRRRDAWNKLGAMTKEEVSSALSCHVCSRS